MKPWSPILITLLVLLIGNPARANGPQGSIMLGTVAASAMAAGGISLIAMKLMETTEQKKEIEALSNFVDASFILKLWRHDFLTYLTGASIAYGGVVLTKHFLRMGETGWPLGNLRH